MYASLLQLFALLSENHPDIIAKVESFKGTCRLERQSFADVEPKLAKMLDSLDPDVAFEKQVLFYQNIMLIIT